MRTVKQSTAYDLAVFMTDAADHVSGKTGLTLTITASKAGGSFASISPTVTELSSGWYKVALTSSHTDTLGDLALHITGSGADPTDLLMQVRANILGDTLPANVTQFGGSNGAFSSGRPEVNATHWGGTAVASANVLIDGAITAAKIASDAITSAKIQDAALTAAKFASGAFDAVWSVTTRLLTAGTNIVLAKGTGVTGFNDLSAAQVNAEADTALADYDPPTRAELTSDTNSILSKVLKYVQLMLRKDSAIATDNATEVTAINADGGSGAGAFANTTDSQEALRDRGDAAWTTATGFSTLDAAGVRSAVGLASANLDTQLSTIDGVADDILADTADMQPKLGTPAGASMSADVAAVKSQTAAIEADTQDLQTQVGTAGAGLTQVPWNAAWDAEVQSEVQDAIEANHLDHLLAATYDPASKPGAADALLNELVENDGGASRFTANALEQAPTGGSAPTAAEIADAVWEEAIADHSGTAGSTAESLNAAGSAGDPWTTALPGSYTGSQAGKMLSDILTDTGTTLDGKLDTVDTVVDAIKAKTDNLPAAPAATGDIPSAAAVASQVRTELTTELGRIDAAVSSRLAAAGYTAPLDAAGVRSAVGLASANLDTQLGAIAGYIDTEVAAIISAIAALNNISTADVLSQVQSALTATVADSVPADGTRPSVSSGIYMLTQFLLERAVSGTTVSVKKPDGSTQLFALTLDDATSPTSITRSA